MRSSGAVGQAMSTTMSLVLPSWRSSSLTHIRTRRFCNPATSSRSAATVRTGLSRRIPWPVPSGDASPARRPAGCGCARSCPGYSCTQRQARSGRGESPTLTLCQPNRLVMPLAAAVSALRAFHRRVRTEVDHRYRGVFGEVSTRGWPTGVGMWGSGIGLRGWSAHNPWVVGSSPTRPTVSKAL